MLTARRAVLAAAAATMLALSHGAASAQIAPPRTLEELKAETQARADRNAYPLTGLKPDDVRKALGNINSLDRDEWAKAWGDVAQPYMQQARAAETAGKIKEAQEDYLMAWRLYSFARWPTPNSPGKQKAYELSLDAFQHYASHLDPAPTLVRIPFEGREIAGWLRLPTGAQGAPLVLAISALDSRKEDHVERGEVFVRRGIAIDGGGAYLLPRLIGLAKAKELVFFGDELSATDAERLGLVNKVVPAAELEATLTAWARRLAEGPTFAIGLSKRLLNRSLQAGMDTLFAEEAFSQALAANSEDMREGIRSFMEKRAPAFKGR